MVKTSTKKREEKKKVKQLSGTMHSTLAWNRNPLRFILVQHKNDFPSQFSAS